MRPAVVVMLLVASLFPSLAARDAAGYWEGAVQVPGLELQVTVELEHGEDGWAGTIDFPGQGIRGLRLIGVEVGENRSVRFGLPDLPGAPLFDGKTSGDAATLAGEFVQHGERYPFELRRGEAPAGGGQELFRDYSGPGVPGEGFPGTWNGVLRSGPARLRLSLSLEAGENGALGGTLRSVDQGDVRLDIGGVARLDDRLIIELNSIGAVIDVRLGADGTMLDGRWEQELAGIDLPLQLHRRPE